MFNHVVRYIIAFIAVVTLAGFFQPGFAFAAKNQLPQVDATLYATNPVPLQPAECGQCHAGQFTDLKNAGGKHRFACQECHEVFHAYNPRKNNYNDIMPVCSTCHGQPHGQKQVECIGCHQNPHSPLAVPAMEKLAKSCSDCHAGPTKELADFPSAHTKQGCQTCHYERHGYIPNCGECHNGHYEGQQLQECKTCHARVHAPLNIKFAANAKVQNCSGCHDTVYAKWKATPSKHGQVSCAMCHQKHGQIPDCRECHAEPHNKKQLEMFPNCLTCHVDVHDLPVKER